MEFKKWVEQESSLGSAEPEMAPPAVNNDKAPASAEVTRTGMQPQVGAKTPTEAATEDKIASIDDKIEDMDYDLDLPDEDDSEKINKFKNLWNKFKERWGSIKNSEETPDPTTQGFGDMNAKEYEDMMRSNPNMTRAAQYDQGPHGPGTFGES